MVGSDLHHRPQTFDPAVESAWINHPRYSRRKNGTRAFHCDSRDQSDQVLCAGVSVGSAHAQRVRHADLALGVEVPVDVGGGLDV